MEGLYKKVSGTFLIKTIGLAIGFIFQISLTRNLEPTLYGKYSMIFTYSSILSVFVILGMDRNLIKEVAKIDNKKVTALNLLKFSIHISMFSIVILYTVILIFHKNFSKTLYFQSLIIVVTLISVIMKLFDGYLQGIGMIIKVTFFRVLLNSIIKIVFFIFLLNIKLNPFLAAICSFLMSEIICIILRAFEIKHSSTNLLSIKINKNYKINFIKYSLTLFLIAGIGILMQNIDKVMISFFLSFESVGIYKVSQNYVALISLFIAPFVAFWPMISKLYKENNILKIEIEMKKIIKIVSSLVIPMFFVFYFLNDKLLSIFGEMYITKESKNVLMILGAAFLIDAISGPIASILTMSNYAKYVLINNIISLIINIVLNYFFIKAYGVVGVALGTGFSIVISNIISIVEVKMLLNIFAYDIRNLIQIILFSLLSFVLGSWLNEILIIRNIYVYIVIFSGILYFVNIGVILLLKIKVIKKMIKNSRIFNKSII